MRRVGLITAVVVSFLLFSSICRPPSAAAAVDLTGSWHLILAFPSRGITALNFGDISLKQSGTAISGSLKSAGRPIKGTLDGTAVALTISFESSNGSGDVLFKGTVENANTMRGTVTMPQLGPGTWTAIR